MELIESDGGTLPLPEAVFAKACTINTAYVLAEPGAVFREMFRVLKPGGRIGVSCPFREAFMEFPLVRNTPGFHFHELDEIRSALEGAGASALSEPAGPRPPSI